MKCQKCEKEIIINAYRGEQAKELICYQCKDNIEKEVSDGYNG